MARYANYFLAGLLIKAIFAFIKKRSKLQKKRENPSSSLGNNASRKSLLLLQIFWQIETFCLIFCYDNCIKLVQIQINTLQISEKFGEVIFSKDLTSPNYCELWNSIALFKTCLDTLYANCRFSNNALALEGS